MVAHANPSPSSLAPRFSFFTDLRRVLASTLPPTERLILIVMLSHRSSITGEISVGLPRVARETGLALRTVEAHVARLRLAGWLVARGRSSYGTVAYALGATDRAAGITDDPPDRRRANPPIVATGDPGSGDPQIRESSQGARAAGGETPAGAVLPFRAPVDAAPILETLAASPDLQPIATRAAAAAIAEACSREEQPLPLAAAGLRKLAAAAALARAAGERWPLARLRAAALSWALRELPARPGLRRTEPDRAPEPLDLEACRRDSTPGVRPPPPQTLAPGFASLVAAVAAGRAAPPRRSCEAPPRAGVAGPVATGLRLVK